MLKEKYRKDGAAFYTNKDAGVNVFLGHCVETGEQVVIKEQLYPSINQANYSLQEALLQSRLDHPHIAQLYTAEITHRDGNFVFTLVMEYVRNGDLFHEIERRKQENRFWGEVELLRHLYALVQALNYAKKRGVAHRDIKPQNIFIAQDGSLKIGDFGSSANTFASHIQTTSLGSPYYLSPELKQNYLQMMGGQVPYDAYKSDVFSLAVTVCLMATLEVDMRLPTSTNPAQELERIVSELCNYPRLQQYLSWMIRQTPEERVSFEDLEQQLKQALSTPQLQCCKCGGPVNSEWVEFSQSQQISLVCSQGCMDQIMQTCSICNNRFLQSPAWPEDLQEFYDCYAKYCFCSKECIWNYHFHSICGDCRKSLQDGSVYRLNCGHFFHADHCFTTFLGKFIENYTCPFCHTPLTESDLQPYTGMCNYCKRDPLVILPVSCGHFYCVTCLLSSDWCCFTCSLPNSRF